MGKQQMDFIVSNLHSVKFPTLYKTLKNYFLVCTKSNVFLLTLL